MTFSVTTCRQSILLDKQNQKEISFIMQSKRILLLNGPSSSGKSTLSAELQALIQCKDGKSYSIISIDDLDLSILIPAFRYQACRHLGLIQRWTVLVGLLRRIDHLCSCIFARCHCLLHRDKKEASKCVTNTQGIR